MTATATASQTASRYAETDHGRQSIKGKIGTQDTIKIREGEPGKSDYVTFNLCQNAPTADDPKAVIWYSVSIPQTFLFPILTSGLTVEVTGHYIVRTDTQTGKQFHNIRGFQIKFF